MGSYEELFDKVEALQNLLVAHATGGVGDDEEYKQLRAELLAESILRDRLPRFLRTHRDLGQFWQYIKRQFSTYQERREYLWGEFSSTLQMLEERAAAPSDAGIAEALEILNSETVHQAWQRALDRRLDDPEGAITAARSLLESVCKHVLDELTVPYEDAVELPKLYKLVADALQLAPSQHTEQVFKQILGACTAIVEGLGALRNRLGDAHGKGKAPVRPAARHAELAVNLAGATATFLVATLEARKPNAT
jgi:hypothetical protein